MTKNTQKTVSAFQWFVEPLDPNANEGIARELARDCAIDLNRLADKNQEMHDLYLLRGHKDVTSIKLAAKKFGWKVKFWKRRGFKAAIEVWLF